MRITFLQRILNTKSLVALFVLLTLFFTYPTFFYNTTLILLDAYESLLGYRVYIMVRDAVYIFSFITAILLIADFPKKAANKEKTENLVSINSALQAFTTQAVIALGMHSYALQTYHPLLPGGGHFVLIELTYLSLFIVSLILIAASLTLIIHHELGNKLGQLASVLTLIGHVGAIIGMLVSSSMTFNFGIGSSLVLAATSALALYYLRKPYTVVSQQGKKDET